MTRNTNGSNGFTSLPVRKRTKERLESLKPFDSLSWDEFAEELADTYEEGRR